MRGGAGGRWSPSQPRARSIDPEALRFWEVLGSLKMSLLAWRAFARTPEGPERDLLERLYHQLGTELEQVLLA